MLACRRLCAASGDVVSAANVFPLPFLLSRPGGKEVRRTMSIYEAAEGGEGGGGGVSAAGGGSELSESLSSGGAKGVPLGERLSALTAPLQPLATKVGVTTNVLALALAVLVAVIVGAATGAFGGGGGLFGPKTVTVGRFVAVESVMSQIDAERYCDKEVDHGKGLASIHTEADQAAAVQACGQLDLARTWDGSDNDGKPSYAPISPIEGVKVMGFGRLWRKRTVALE
eukprot:COSAG04_NODE_1218_length_7708_cov_1.979629_4_plen_228_part_00